MEQLETTKGKSIVVPRLVNRYLILAYHKTLGWQSDIPSLYTTPESAMQDFIERQNKYGNENYIYYKVIEVELEIPIVPNK